MERDTRDLPPRAAGRTEAKSPSPDADPELREALLEMRRALLQFVAFVDRKYNLRRSD